MTVGGNVYKLVRNVITTLLSVALLAVPATAFASASKHKATSKSAAWVIGARNTLKSLLAALLDPAGCSSLITSRQGGGPKHDEGGGEAAHRGSGPR